MSYLEQYDSELYNQRLMRSIKDNPTNHTLFMMNRVVNDNEDYKKEFIEILNEIITLKDVDSDIKETAIQFRSFQLDEEENVDYNKIRYNLVLIKEIGREDLVKIKKNLGINSSITELYKNSKKLPFILATNITERMGQRLIKKLEWLSEKLLLEKV